MRLRLRNRQKKIAESSAPTHVTPQVAPPEHRRNPSYHKHLRIKVLVRETVTRQMSPSSNVRASARRHDENARPVTIKSAERGR
jgi:hypothetical protein